MIETLGLIAAAGAALGSVLYIAGRIRAAWRRLRQLWVTIDAGMDLIQRELGETDHDDPGTSMKEDLTRMAVAIGKLQRQQATLSLQLLRIVMLGAKHHPEDEWQYREDPPP